MAAILPYLPAAATALAAFLGNDAQEDTNRANQQNAREQMDFQERMSNTAHQREVKDLISAGLNPMLSAKLGGSSTPSGAMSISQNPVEAGSRAASNTAGTLGVTTQIANVQAQTHLANAQTAKTEAERDEVIARTPTHEANIQSTLQGIDKMRVEMQGILSQIDQRGVSIENLRQQTENLREVIPQIRATIENLRAHTVLHGAHTALAATQTTETQQRIKANLPALEGALKDLERVQQQMSIPAHQAAESFHGSKAGAIIDAIGKALKALNPFSGIIPQIGR